MAGLLTIFVFAVFVFFVALFKSQWLVYLYVTALPFFGVLKEIGLTITQLSSDQRKAVSEN